MVLSQITFVLINNHLTTLAWAISLGVRNIAFSSIVWTYDVADMGKHSLGMTMSVERPLGVNVLPGHTDYHLVHSQKY